MRKPQSWDTAVSVALLRMIGATQEVAAEGAGCARRSVLCWEQSSWWPEAVAEARSRWFKGGDQRAMRALYRSLEGGDGHTARWWAERRIAELKPPKLSHELSGPKGDPIAVQVIRIGGRDITF